MKNKIIVIKNIIVILILIIAIIFFISSIKYKQKLENENIVIEENTINNSEIIEEKAYNKVQNIPKRIFPNDIAGFEIIGNLEIPKIGLSTYILAKTNDESLDKSVTKLCGPDINEEGNFCIIGHNFNKTNMFRNLKKIEIDDVIILTNIYGQKIEYAVYDIYKVYPNEVKCLSQETYGNREITLITCTTGAIKRLIVKATEIYD